MKRILLVDDYDSTLSCLAQVLDLEGYDVVSADSGHEAVTAWLNSIREDRPFDLIILDVAMPFMSGTEAASLIRTSEEEAGHRPSQIVFLSAHTETIPKEELLSLHVSGVWTKPIDMPDLRERITRLIGPGETPLQGK